MFKNVTGQKIRVFAFDTMTGAAKTGDAANITAYVNKDWGGATVLGDTSATEIDATNAKGCYLFDLTQAETNADALDFTAKSTTANISIVPQLIYTFPASFTSFVTPTNLTAAQIATGIFQDATAGDFTVAGTFGKSVMNGVALGTGLTINAYTGNTPQTGDAYARIGAPAGASTAADIAAVKVDTAAVKVQTDKLTYTITNQVDVNIKSVRGTAVGSGVGTAGSPWGP